MTEDEAFHSQDIVLQNGGQDYPALVFTPRRPQLLDRERLLYLRGAKDLNTVDEGLLGELRKRGRAVNVTIFRAVNAEGERVWGIDPTLSEAEQHELGFVLCRALLPLHRGMLSCGTTLFVHTDLTFDERRALQHGVRRMSETLAQRPRAHPALQDVDLWILKNMLFHFDTPFERATQSLLPSYLKLATLRAPRVEEMLSKLPKGALSQRPSNPG